MHATLLAHRVMNLMNQRVPKGFIELKEQYVNDRLSNSNDPKDYGNMLTWSELR